MTGIEIESCVLLGLFTIMFSGFFIVMVCGSIRKSESAEEMRGRVKRSPSKETEINKMKELSIILLKCVL